jgi:hypothetical protein
MRREENIDSEEKDTTFSQGKKQSRISSFLVIEMKLLRTACELLKERSDRSSLGIDETLVDEWFI